MTPPNNAPAKTVTTVERGFALVCAVLVLACALWALFNILELPREFPLSKAVLFVAAILVVNVLAMVSIGAMLVLVLCTGIMNRRTLRACLGWGWIAYMALLGCLFLLMSRHLGEGVREDVLIIGMVQLTYGGVTWMRFSVARSEWKTTDKLLDIEAQLEAIREALGLPPRQAEPPANQTEE
jgi:hypothetical protein